MASDVSRRWIDNSWSCRIKLPNPISKPPQDGSRLQRNVAPPAVLDLTMDSTSPASRRNQGKLAEAIQSMSELNGSMDSLDLPTDPDAQATVTDFLDFTEYLPSDMIRSLTLIGNLDQAYCGASASINELTRKYGALPTLPLDERADPVALRAEISSSLNEALSARTSAHAEATRMAENVDRHYNRAKTILAKLQDMMEKYPSSRDASPVATKAQSPVVSRVPKITLRLGGEHTLKVRKHRAPRITVPGEVLAPYELDYESYGSSSDEFEQEAITPRATPARSTTAAPKIIRLKIQKPKKDKEKSEKSEKTARPPRPPGTVGTNVHSAVAGISTSNALAMLHPPPPAAAKGSEHKPWLQLTAWELANLRKRMKKNAVWSPSDTMISRELKLHGRGIEAYREAKALAEADGGMFDSPIPPQLLGETVHAEGAISVEALRTRDVQLSNKGMKLNEAKKLKKENEAKELARQAAEEAEESARKMTEAAKAMKSLFNKPDQKKTPAKTPGKSKAATQKRKREDSITTNDTENPAEGEAVKSVRPLLKRTKTETPIPVPIPVTKQSTPTITSSSASVASDRDVSVPSTSAETMQAPAASPKKTPILPPKKEIKKVVKKAIIKPDPIPNTRTRRSSAAAKTPTPVPELPASKRPSSSRSSKGFDQATATIDRPRRSSTARNTPAPPALELRLANKRAKRPAPGLVASGTEGSTAVTIGKRSAATRKKAGSKKEKKDGGEGSAIQEVYDEIDDEGNIIDPDEPRYCSCNRVSFGTMIGCENADCEKEWFHLECVNLAEIPPRTTKWYCPQCRVKLGIGEKGEVNARGRKK